MLRKLLEFLIEAFSLAGKMEAEGAVPYEWEDLNTWANRPYNCWELEISMGERLYIESGGCTPEDARDAAV